jgi:hypothetical protein
MVVAGSCSEETAMKVVSRANHTTDRTGDLQVLLALCSIGAGVIHLAVVPEHLEEDRVFGVFFIVTAGLQIAWAIPVVFRAPAIVYAIGALANGALIGTWVASRTIGLPIGPHLWMPEPARALDVSASFLELLLVVGSLVLVRRRMHVDRYDASSERLGREDQVCV